MTKIALLVSLLLVMIAPSFGGAQDSVQCPTLVAKAFESLGQSCNALDRNSACYGYNRVDATFRDAVADDFFTQPGNTTELTPLETIHTYGLDEALQRWGIALMRVQANVPNTLPGQAVIFMLLGESAAQNAVKPEDALTPTDLSVDVTTNVKANLRSGPGLNSNVVDVADVGSILKADALSDGLNWLRVLYNNAPAWVNREVVNTADGLDTLPVIKPDTRTPMQAFYFTTKIDQADCSQAPDTLLIQGPQHMKIDLDANQANIQIGSTILLSMIDKDTMQLVVLDGQANVGNLIIPEGFKAFAPLRLPDDEEAKNILLDNGKIVAGPWKECQPIPADELAGYKSLEGIPPQLLNYPITMPDAQRGECSKPSTGEPNQSTGGACGTTFPGEAADKADCCGFAATAPAGTIPYDNVGFAWNPARGATSYQVNLFGADDGRYITSFNTAGAETQMSIFTPALSDGSNFTWEVAAMVDGKVACTTPRVNITRTPGGGGSDDGGGRPFTPNVCGNNVCEPRNGENRRTCPADC
ncbi:MAG: SH3 domain-containing protein [Chloroflexota bacterium]